MSLLYSKNTMYFYLVAPSIVVRANEHAFTYHSDVPLPVGALVRVSVGARTANGVIIAVLKQKPTFATKPITTVLAPQPLPTPLLKVAQWMSDYYATHFATVLQTILPAGLHKQRRSEQKLPDYPIRKRTQIILNKEQSSALTRVNSPQNGTFLLHGVTGSGKTRIYIEAAKHEARQGRSSIILVPEIALTPQLVAEFANHFQNLIVTHSSMSEAKRHHVWQQALQSHNQPFIAIGPRSALFMPLNNVGLIVVDECHEPSYKQEQSPRYLALRVASMLGKYHDAKLILGSATPAITDYYIAHASKVPVVQLSRPAAQTQPVDIEVIDLKSQDHFKKHRFLSDPLLAKIEQTLAQEQQVLLFHNRRGSAPTTMCTHCGWLAECTVCYLPLTLHADHHKLICHICGLHRPVPPNCPECHQPTVIFKGIGTKMIEAEVSKIFPKAHIARFDADTHAKQAVHHRYQELYDGTIDILIGTQMLAKGLDLPRLTLVGVIQADSGLILPDYTAKERVFQLLQQVIGRAGRGQYPGQVVIQTYQPDHPVVKAAVNRDYKTFYQTELSERKAGSFPPFRFLLKMTCSYKTERGAVSASKKMAASIKHSFPSVNILGPAPAFYERMGGNYRWQIIIKGRQRSELIKIANNLPANWQTDIDPVSIL